MGADAEVAVRERSLAARDDVGGAQQLGRRDAAVVVVDRPADGAGTGPTGPVAVTVAVNSTCWFSIAGLTDVVSVVAVVTRLST